MVEFITGVYFFYIFISLYMLILFFLIYIPNRKKFFYYPPITKDYSLDMIVPCYNEQENLEGTIRCLLNSDYKNLKKVIVVDDCSTDNSFEIVKRIAKEDSRVIAVQTPKNTGKASGAKNYGVQFSNAELIGFSDADSYPEKDAISKMIGFFDEEKVGAVTSSIFAKNKEKFIEKLQSLEYRIIVFSRKLLGFVDSIYVTPGPLAIYQRKIFEEIGKFDENNLTEDIEITWNLASKHYKVRMSPSAKVYTIVPNEYSHWLKQRVRWNVGGIQTIMKYKKSFLARGMLGSFILPFFVFSWIIGISGFLILIYRSFRNLIINLLSLFYFNQTNTPMIVLEDINLTPSVLFLFGIFIMLFSLIFTLISLNHSKEAGFKKNKVINLLAYMFVYVLSYPVILFKSAYKAIRGGYSW